MSDPAVFAGKPCIRGTRISVDLFLGWLAAGWSADELLESYPSLHRADILAALRFAQRCVRKGARLRV
jgi:uncharacterized protein (DUF433 family)